jgi:hypothetical protein
MQKADLGTLLEVPVPVLFNTFKHHAGALRVRIRQAIAVGEPALLDLVQQSVVLGSKLMDLYTGVLWPGEIAGRILAHLSAAGRLELPAFRSWLEEQGEYAVVTLPEDRSNWVLRLGDESERYVHLHPGRWSPASARVRANVIKTAFFVLIHAGIHGENPMDRTVVDFVRQQYLKLSPVGRDPEGELGLGSVIELLRQGPVPDEHPGLGSPGQQE